MPLEKQLIDIPFSGSMQDQVDERLVPNEQLLTVGNMVYRKDGRLSQRYGWSELGNISAGFTFAAKSLFSFGNNQLGVMTGDSGAVVWSEEDQAWKDTSGGQAQVSLETHTLHKNAHRAIQADAAYVNGYYCYVWCTREEVSPFTLRCFGAVFDSKGRVELPTFELPTNMDWCPRVVGFDNTFVIFAQDGETAILGGGGTVHATTISTSATLVVPSSATSMGLAGSYDVSSPDPLVNDCYIVVYNNFRGDIDVARVDSSLTKDDTASVTQSTNRFITLYYNNTQNTVYILYGVAGTAPVDVHVRTKTVGSGGISAATTVGTTDLVAGANFPATIGPNNSAKDEMRLCWPINTPGHKTRVIDDTVSTVTSEVSYEYYVVTSKIQYVVGVGTVYSVTPNWDLMVDPGSDQAPDALYQHHTLVTPGDAGANFLIPLARYHYGDALPPHNEGGSSNSAFHITHLAEASATRFVLAAPVLDAFLDLPVGDSVSSYVKYTTLSFDSEDAQHVDSLNKAAAIPGGLVQYLDGVQVTPAGFSFAPILNHVEDDTNNYKVKVLYEWVDAFGLTHRSPLSLAKHPDSSQEVRLVLPFDIPTRDTTHTVTIKVFKSDAEFSNFYLFQLFEMTEPSSGTTTQTLDLDTSGVDTSAPQPYTVGGVLSADPAPPMNKVTTAAGRLWGVDAEDPRGLYYTKRGAPDLVPEWNEALHIHLPEEAILAVASLDDKVVFFGEDNVYVTAGEGPTRAGSGDFPRPQKIQAVGLRDAESVVSTPVGLFYSSYEGIYLLDRGLSNQYVGGGIEDRLFNSNGTRLPVIAAVHLPRDTEVRFLLQNKDQVQSDLVLVYNYQFGRWSYFDNHNGIDAINWDGTFVHLNDSPEVRYEVEDQWYDDSVDALDYLPSIDTAWIRVGSVEGLQRVRRLLFTGRTDTAEPAQVWIAVYYDYDDSSAFTVKKYTKAEVATVQKGNFFELEWGLPRQKCSAVRFHIFGFRTVISGETVGNDSSDANAFFDAISMTLEVGQKRNTFTHGTDHRGSTPSS